MQSNGKAGKFPPSTDGKVPHGSFAKTKFTDAGVAMSMDYHIMTLAGHEIPLAHSTNGRKAVRNFLLFVLPILMLAGVGLIAAHWIPLRYAASADLMIHMQQPGDAVQRYYASQNLILKAPSLLEPIALSAGSSVEDLSQYLSVDFPKGSDIMRVRYQNVDPQQALTILRKILAAYEIVVAPIELNEGAVHQVVSAPAPLKNAVFPQPSQFAAIGAAIGLIFSMMAFAFLRLSQPPNPR